MNTVPNLWDQSPITRLLDKALTAPEGSKKERAAHELGFYKGIIVGAIIVAGIVIKMTKE